MANEKRFHSLIVDTGPLIKNTISISTIIQSAKHIYSTPAILSEIKDAATRSRVETTLLPFLNVRSPTPASYEAVTKFSKKTGDFAVLSRQDLGILALAYEIDQERKKEEGKVDPSQVKEGLDADKSREDESKTVSQLQIPRAQTVAEHQQVATQEVSMIHADIGANGQSETLQELVSGGLDSPNPVSSSSIGLTQSSAPDEEGGVQLLQESTPLQNDNINPESDPVETELTSEERPLQPGSRLDALIASDTAPADLGTVEQQISNLELSQQSELSDPDDDGEGEWITPSNVKKHQAKDSGVSIKATEPQNISVATMTTDYAMQNVLLQMKLALISPSMQRIRNLRTYVLRCHACFLTTKEMDKQFCPRCGQPTLQRVSCSTNAKGEFRIHLAKNYQWNLRGNKYSVPKPVAGTANGKNIKGGGKGGWGNELILAEDQKEFTRHAEQEKRSKARDLMDEDYLPGILTGDRGRAGGRAKVGAGKNINSKKRF